MMVPIALSVIDLVLRSRGGVGLKNPGAYHRTAFLSATLPPVCSLRRLRGIERRGRDHHRLSTQWHRGTLPAADVSAGSEFFDWLLVGGPFTLIFLPIAWLLITRVLFRADIGEIAGGRKQFDEEYRKLGPLTRGEKVVLTIFCMSALLWTLAHAQ